MIQLSAQKMVKTRKKHQCHGCLKMFEAGTEMKRSSYADQGDAWSIYLCNECIGFIIDYPEFVYDFYNCEDGATEGFVNYGREEYDEDVKLKEEKNAKNDI